MDCVRISKFLFEKYNIKYHRSSIWRILNSRPAFKRTPPKNKIKDKVNKIILSDKRLIESGSKRGNKILYGVYKIKIHPDTLRRYRKEILNQTITKC